MAREYAPETPSTSKREYASTAVAEPSVGEKAGAALYGLGTGVVSAPGELEEFGAYTVPQFLGLQPQTTPRETLFPTQKDIESGLQKYVGIAPPRAEVSAYKTAGELAPAIAAGGTGLYKLGKYGVAGASDLASLLMGKKTAQEASKTAEAATKAGTSAEKALSATEAAQQEKIAQATKAGKKAGTQAELALGQMPGVTTMAEAGKFKPIPESASKVGDFMRQQTENFVKSIKQQRSVAADTNFKNALNEANLYQKGLQEFVDTSPLTNEIDALIAKGGSSDYIRSINQLKNDLAITKDFEGLENIRRKLGDAAFGLPEEGYKAIGQGFAKDMYGKLATQMKEYSPAFEKYLDDYKRLSKNIESLGTKVGKGLTETEGGPGYYKKTAEQVAKDVFGNPEKYKQFIDTVGGNKQVAEAAARRYFAGQLETVKDAKGVEDFLRKNRDVLNEMPNVRKEIEDRVLSTFKKSEARGKAAEEIVKGIPVQSVEKARTAISDAVQSLSTAKPGKAIETFENTVLPKIRQAEQDAGTKLLTDQEINNLRKQVAQLEGISDKTQRARLISGFLAGTLGINKITGLASSLIGGQ